MVEDIGKVLTDPPDITDEQANELGHSLSAVVKQKLNRAETAPALRMSNLGTKCNRKLWYMINKPETAIPLRPENRLKFLYGDIIETLVLWLAKLAGHEVKGEQDELVINGVVGHRDGIVDGLLVDVKSASSYSFKKFEEGIKPETDAFGYLDQLGSYAGAGGSDDGAFIAVDKTLGHIHVDRHNGIGKRKDWVKLVDEKRALIKQKIAPPKAYFDEPEGASGNRKLAMECSYCDFRKECWPGLRTFLYANKPVYLTHVVRLPKVQEIE